jgi:hypothetical protein
MKEIILSGGEGGVESVKMKLRGTACESCSGSLESQSG